MMGMIREGVKAIWNQKWALGMLYLLHLGFGAVVGSRMQAALREALGSSAAGTQLVRAYDSDVMADLTRHEGLDLGVVASSGGLALVIFLAVGILLYGGLIHNIITTQNGLRSILTGGTRHFLSFAVVSLAVALLIVLATSIIWVPFLSISGAPPLTGALEVYHSEKQFFFAAGAILCLCYAVILLISSWGIVSKANIVSGKSKPCRLAASLVVKNWWRILLFGLLTVVIAAFSIWILSLLRNMVTGHLAAHFIVGQCIVIALCKLRIWYIGGVASLTST